MGSEAEAKSSAPLVAAGGDLWTRRQRDESEGETGGAGRRRETSGFPGDQVPPREEKREKQKEDGKLCRNCGETRTPTEFPANRRVSDGLSSWCRACHNRANAQWREKKRIAAQRVLNEKRRRLTEGAARETARRRKGGHE